MARPTKLTDNLRRRVATNLRAGNPIDVAVRACHLAPSTHYDWMAKGAALEDVDPDALQGKPLDAALEAAGLPKTGRVAAKRARIRALRGYREAVLNALADAEASAVLKISTAAKDDWRAAAWLLERAHPERWAKPSPRGARIAKQPPPDADPPKPERPEEPNGDQFGL